jgi:hypothetical protein
MSKGKIIQFEAPTTQPAGRNKSTPRRYQSAQKESHKPYTVNDTDGAPLAAYLAMYGYSMMRNPQQWAIWKRAMGITDEQVTDALQLLKEQECEVLQFKRVA